MGIHHWPSYAVGAIFRGRIIDLSRAYAPLPAEYSWRPLPDGLPEAVQLHRSGASGLSKPAQGGVTTVGTFEYLVGDDPTGPVLFAAGRKK